MSSVVGYLRKNTNWDRDITGQQSQSTREDMWGPIDGEIVDYDAAAGTATVKPLYKPVMNGEAVDMPNLYEVPIEFPRSGNSGITFPVPAGTKVRLTPQMRSREKYDLEQDGEPSDKRSFHLSDMTATITGGDSLADPMQNVDADNAHFRFSVDGQYGIRGNSSGKIAIEGAEGNIYTLLAQAIRLIAEDQLQIAYGSSAGTGHALANKAALQEIAGKLEAMAL